MSDPFNDVTNPVTPTPNPAAPTPAATAADPFADQLGMIVNADGQPKYKDVGSALTALNASQSHIGTLESERASDRNKIAELEAELASRQSVADAVAQLRSPQAETPATPSTEAVAGLDEATVTEIIQNQMQAAEQASKASANRASVVDAVKQAHGENAAKFIQEKAAAVGTSAAELGKLAESNPQMAFAILGELKAPANPAAPVTPTQAALPPASRDGMPAQFEQSSARGGMTQKDLAARWRQVAEATNVQLGVQS